LERYDELARQANRIAEIAKPSAVIEEMIRQSERWAELTRPSKAVESMMKQMTELSKTHTEMLNVAQMPFMREHIVGISDHIRSVGFESPMISRSIFDAISTIAMKPPLLNDSLLTIARSVNATFANFTAMNNSILASIRSTAATLGSVAARSAIYNENMISVAHSVISRLSLHNDNWLDGIGVMARNMAQISANASVFSRYYDEFKFDEYDEYFVDDEFSDDDIDELGKALHSITESTDDFSVVYESQVAIVSERNPLLAKMLKYILFVLIIPFLFTQLASCAVNYFISQRNAPLREQPNSTSIVINNITINQQLFIVAIAVPIYIEL